MRNEMGNKKNILMLIILNVLPLVFIIFWFIFMFLSSTYGFNTFFRIVENYILVIFITYLDKYLYVLDSIILLICLIFYSKKSINKYNIIKKIIMILLIVLFNAIIDIFIYSVYCLLLSV